MSRLLTGDELFVADHDGQTYERERDKVRLNNQTQRVYDCVKDGWWRTLAQIADATKSPEASISARLRDLRKPKFGGHTIERRHVAAGLWQYRLVNK